MLMGKPHSMAKRKSKIKSSIEQEENREMVKEEEEENEEEKADKYKKKEEEILTDGKFPKTNKRYQGTDFKSPTSKVGREDLKCSYYTHKKG